MRPGHLASRAFSMPSRHQACLTPTRVVCTAMRWAQRSSAPWQQVVPQPAPRYLVVNSEKTANLKPFLVALGTFQGKDNANITEAKAWLRQSQQPQMASRVGRLAETRNGKAHPDVTLTATSRPSSAAGPAKSKSLLEFLFSNSHYSARSIRCCNNAFSNLAGAPTRCTLPTSATTSEVTAWGKYIRSNSALPH